MSAKTCVPHFQTSLVQWDPASEAQGGLLAPVGGGADAKCPRFPCAAELLSSATSCFSAGSPGSACGDVSADRSSSAPAESCFGGRRQHLCLPANWSSAARQPCAAVPDPAPCGGRQQIIRATSQARLALGSDFLASPTGDDVELQPPTGGSQRAAAWGLAKHSCEQTTTGICQSPIPLGPVRRLSAPDSPILEAMAKQDGAGKETVSTAATMAEGLEWEQLRGLGWVLQAVDGLLGAVVHAARWTEDSPPLSEYETAQLGMALAVHGSAARATGQHVRRGGRLAAPVRLGQALEGHFSSARS
mmetsp:Transcript_7000/g.17261  ORF Transcript_7000/g.17261 Transcript_7000/m.17261 type:complete len:303 (+) Transcript_7000:319-1227(+)